MLFYTRTITCIILLYYEPRSLWGKAGKHIQSEGLASPAMKRIDSRTPLRYGSDLDHLSSIRILVEWDGQDTRWRSQHT